MTAAERAALEEMQKALRYYTHHSPDLWTLKEILEKCNFHLHPPAT